MTDIDALDILVHKRSAHRLVSAFQQVKKLDITTVVTRQFLVDSEIAAQPAIAARPAVRPLLLRHLDSLARKWAQLDTALPGLNELQEINIWMDHHDSFYCSIDDLSLLTPFISLAQRQGILAKADLPYRWKRKVLQEEQTTPFTVVWRRRDEFKAEVDKHWDKGITYKELPRAGGLVDCCLDAVEEEKTRH
jgi:hypothetical protein